MNLGSSILQPLPRSFKFSPQAIMNKFADKQSRHASSLEKYSEQTLTHGHRSQIPNDFLNDECVPPQPKQNFLTANNAMNR